MDLSHSTGAVRRVSLKQFPVQFTLQSPIEAALELRQQLGGAAIEKLRIEVHADAARRTADPAKFKPANRETADHSLPCCVAMALLDGRLDKQQFDAGRWQQADVAALMGRIEVTPSQELEQRWPGGRPVRMTAVLRDGSEHGVLVPVPLGDSTRPMDQAAITRKFMRLAEPVLGARQAAQVVQQVGQLERLPDVRGLCRLLSGGAVQPVE
jgi:2-methylcitrate dehydratase